MSVPTTALGIVAGAALVALGVAAWRVRQASLAGAARARECDVRERCLLDAVALFLDASRRSSEAVLAALDRALRELDGRIDSVLVFTPAGDELMCVYAGGARAQHYRRLALRRDDAGSLAVTAAETGCRAVVPAGGALSPTDRFAMAVPMIDPGALRAVVYVSSSHELCEPLGDAIVRAIEHAVAPYAIALEREADRAEATYDGLTGLLCARAFRVYLSDEVERAKAAHDRVLGLWFVDTDCFKDVNDRFGHRAGDAVLQAMASLLEAHLVPDLDIAARNGGDEFCALLRGASKSRCIERAQAFCDAVRRHDFGLPLRVTASVGIASYPHDASSSSALLEAADAAMYHSKRNGRDRASFVVDVGAFASVAPEAAAELPRSSSRWRSKLGEFFAERSPQ